MNEPRVLLALTPLAEDALEQALFAPDAGFQLAASVAEADELETAAIETGATVALVSPDLSGLLPGHCARLRALGLRLVGLALDETAEAHLDALGVDATVAPDLSAEALVVTLRRDDRDPRTGAKTEAKHEPASANTVRGGRGNVLAVLGCKGAPGTSEAAASLAALAAERWATVLVELDLLGGSLDLRLNADPREGSLIAAVRAAERERAAGELLERWLVRRPGWPPVLLAPPDAERLLGELARPGAIRETLAALTRSFALTVCDVGWPLTGGEAAKAHREAVVAADAVLLVLGGRDDQLRAGLVELDRLVDELEVPAERLRVALNGSGAPGTTAKATLLEAAKRQLAERGLALDATLPWDGRALARATVTALPLALARRRGGYARALARLLDELFLPTEPAPRKRKLKLAVPAKPAADEEVALPWRM